MLATMFLNGDNTKKKVMFEYYIFFDHFDKDVKNEKIKSFITNYFFTGTIYIMSNVDKSQVFIICEQHAIYNTWDPSKIQLPIKLWILVL